MVGKAIPACFLSTLILTAGALAQERIEGIKSSQIDTVRPGNTASISSDQNINTFQTTGSALYDNRFGPLSLSFNELFISTVTQTDMKRITDEQNFGLFVRHRLNSWMQAAGKVSSLIVSDNQSLGITNVSSNAFYGGVELLPLQSLVVTPLLGMRYEDQSGQKDHGLSYLLNVDSDNLMYGDYHTGITARWEYDDLSPRTLETRYLGLSAEKYFFSQTRNNFIFRYTRNKRDFYSPADATIQSDFGVTSNIETRAEDAYFVGDSLDYGIGQNFLLRFQGNVFTRTIDRETRYKYYAGNPDPGANTTTQEVRFEGGTEARFNIDQSFSTAVRVFYQERDEKHEVVADDSLSDAQDAKYSTLEENRNNHSRRTWLSLTTSFALSSSNLISLTGSTGLLRYDTPSTGNDDDRDELSYILSLSTSSRFNSHLTMRIFLDANLAHLVYLNATRSADNTWNRILRLSPRLEYSPSNAVTTVNTFEVLANYTSYDFEYPSSPIRSFVFRQFGFNDSTAIELTGRFGIDLFALLRLYERGELRWEGFAERPVTFFDERTLIGSFRYRLHPGLLFSIGIRYFNQSRFAYVGSERVLEQRLRSIGPIAATEWYVSNRTSLLFRGWYEDQQQTGVPNRGIVTMTMNLIVHI